jgi:hypothetical protein
MRKRINGIKKINKFALLKITKKQQQLWLKKHLTGRNPT